MNIDISAVRKISAPLAKKLDSFIKKLPALDLPSSRIAVLEPIGYGFSTVEEFNTHDCPPTVRIVFESSFASDSYIRSELWLPENWNGELLGLGNGGYGGTLTSKYWKYTADGCAVVETDMGTSKLINDEIPYLSYDMLKDYTYRSTHIMTVVAKILIEAYYGKAPDRSFFMGSSAGGLQAYSEAQRYPHDYNAIYGGVPSNNTLNFKIYNIWLYQKLIRPDAKKRFNATEAELINKHAVDFFRAHGDGEEGDNFISFPYLDENTVDDFISYLTTHAPELTDEQLSSLRDVYNGPVHSKTGEQIYSGMPIGSEIFCNLMTKDMDYPIHGDRWLNRFFGEGKDLRFFEYSEDYDSLLSDFAPYYSANDPDLSEFMKCGGKLLSFSGAADRSGSYADTMKYYNKVCEMLGGYDTVSKFFRHFTLPGKAHGNLGRGANVYWGMKEGQSILDTLREWVKTGVAPEYVTVAHEVVGEDGKSSYSFIRRVYPYRADKTEGKDFPKTTDDKFLKATYGK